MTDPAIRIAPDGPYLVSGDARLVAKHWVESDQGEPLAWVTGPALETAERYALCRCGESERKPFCDGAHARTGFDGAETATGTYDERARSLGGSGIEVRDDRSICVHAGFCGTAATNVWKLVAATDTTDARSTVIAMVERCPSGALTYRWEGAEAANEPDLPAQVAVIADGPLWVTGGIPVTRSDGGALEARGRVTLCRCGHSDNKPLCDGSHKEVGFRG